MTTFLILLGVVLASWTWEAVRHRRALAAVPIRIHVNGSRGKSSVTRLIAAGLRESGLPTVAKTTGTAARFIHTDGAEEPILRLGPPNIVEQVGILDRARREKAAAIVIECMAVRPDLQKISEEKILRSTIGVITNVRADHLDVMGPTTRDAAVAISSTLPRRGLAFVGQTDHLDVLEREANRRGSSLRCGRPESVPPGAMDSFGYLEHEENVAVALEVTRSLRIPDDVALRGMHRVTPDPGACTRTKFVVGGRLLEFFNIFAANDVESTLSIWDRVGLGARGDCPSIALLNLRGDRIDRSLQFADVLESHLVADYYVVVGDLTSSVLRRFESKVPAGRFFAPGRASASAVLDLLSTLGHLDGVPGGRAPHGEGGAEPPSRIQARIGGIGNIGGLGHEIVHEVTRSGAVLC